MSNLVPPPNVDGRAYRHYCWKVMARHSYGHDHSDPTSGASVDSNDSGVVCDLPSSLNSSKVSSFEEAPPHKDGQDLYSIPTQDVSVNDKNGAPYVSYTNCDNFGQQQQQLQVEQCSEEFNYVDRNNKQEIISTNQDGQGHVVDQVPVAKRIPPGWSCGVYGSGYENLVVGHFMPPIRPGSASSFGPQQLNNNQKQNNGVHQNMLLDYLSSPGSSNLTSDLSSPSYAERRSPCSVDYQLQGRQNHTTKDLSDEYHRPSQVTFDPLILENVLSPMNETCHEDIFESLIPPDLYSSVSEILDSEELQPTESKDLKELRVKDEDTRPSSSNWNRYTVLPPVLSAPAPTPVDFNPPQRHNGSSDITMAPSASAMSGYSAPLPMFSAAFADSVCSSSFASPRQSTRSSYSGRGSRNKRALSISPLSADGIDINSLIRMSPTSLLPMSGSGSFTSLSPGCYGHLSARNSSSSPSIGSSHRMSVSTNGGASTTTGCGGRHASIKDDFIDLDSNVALYQAMQSLESSIAMQDVLQVSHNQAVLPHNSLQQFEQDLMNRLSEPSSEPHTGSEPPMTAAALPTPTALASLRPSCIPTLNRPPPSYDQHMARKHFLVQKKSSSDSSQPSNYSSFDSSEGDRTGELNDDPSGIRQYICWWIDCGNTFPDQEELVRHLEKTHVDQRKGEEYTCFWQGCQRRLRPFNARYKLLIHMRVHSGEKPNKCSFEGCTKAFSRLENLKIHLRSHTGERPYACQYPSCTKAFSNSSDRAKHQRTHQDTKPYACQIPGCTKRYTDPSSLRKHVKNHTTKTDQAKKKLRGDLNESVDADLLSKCLTIQAIRPNHPILQHGDRDDSYGAHDFMTHDSGLGRSPAHNSQLSTYNSGGYYSNGMTFSNTMSPASHQSSPQALRDIAESSNETDDNLISILQETNQSKLSLPPITQSNRRSPSVKSHQDSSRSTSSRSNISQLPPLNRTPASPGLQWSPGSSLTFPTFQDSFSNKYGIILEDYSRPGGVS